MTVTALAKAPSPRGTTKGRVGGIEFFVIGEGSPVTVFAHGLGGSISETRPLANDVEGTKVFLHFRGHGGSAPIPEGWDYDTLASDLLAVADAVDATHAVGISMGAGALLRLLSIKPDRFDRVAFIMPAALTEQRADGAILRLEIMADAAKAGDEARLTELMLNEVPAELRNERVPQLLAARRARDIARNIPPHAVGDVRPLHDLTELDRVKVPSFVLAQRDDALHPSELAQTLHGALPCSELLVLEPGGIYWTDHSTAKSALAAHLNIGVDA